MHNHKYTHIFGIDYIFHMLFLIVYSPNIDETIDRNFHNIHKLNIISKIMSFLPPKILKSKT